MTDNEIRYQVLEPWGSSRYMYFMLKHCPARALFVCHFISRAPKKTSAYQPWPQRPSITLHKVETSHPEPFTVDQIQSQSFQNHRDLAPGNFPLGIHLPTFDPDQGLLEPIHRVRAVEYIREPFPERRG